MSDPAVKMTSTREAVLQVFLADPTREFYGLEVIRATGLASGTIYPILAYLEDERKWLESRREAPEAYIAEKRPPRTYYRITPDGAALAREAIARAYRGRRRPVPGWAGGGA
ncbi:PadR family transcriptional regulator [Nonomuraea sp. NPDC050556]|uniref:PadR family transcriptional regulator n=1 Tax=Nonomuraea sp. NPDC050556 TaxID=3364369 RepID=UPI0037ACB091